MPPQNVLLGKVGGILHRNVPGDVDRPGVVCGELRIAVIEDRVDDLVHVGTTAAPVVFVRAQDELDSWIPGLELERPGAGASGSEVVDPGRVDD